jgi:hypothetical protein
MLLSMLALFAAGGCYYDTDRFLKDVHFFVDGGPDSGADSGQAGGGDGDGQDGGVGN